MNAFLAITNRLSWTGVIGLPFDGKGGFIISAQCTRESEYSGNPQLLVRCCAPLRGTVPLTHCSNLAQASLEVTLELQPKPGSRRHLYAPSNVRLCHRSRHLDFRYIGLRTLSSPKTFKDAEILVKWFLNRCFQRSVGSFIPSRHIRAWHDLKVIQSAG
jgi:hypothetical protein